MSNIQHLYPRIGFIVALLLLSLSIQAQQAKFGHTNLGNLLELMPETKQAQADLKTLADSLSAVGNAKEKVFRDSLAKVEGDYAAGKLTPLQVQQAQNDLNKLQQELQAFDQQAKQLGSQYRDKLLNPILEKVLNAIQSVAKENGYLMIFDTSSGAMLYADEADDVTALVRKKLGL